MCTAGPFVLVSDESKVVCMDVDAATEAATD